ncbi:MAG: glycoside hydrolase family 16 protein [Chthoniobacterales bacterium]
MRVLKCSAVRAGCAVVFAAWACVSVRAAETAILPVQISPAVVPPDGHLELTYRWDARPMGGNYTVFVHVKNAKGATVMQDDHEPRFPLRTSNWSGAVSYMRRVALPAGLPDGKYRVFAGIYDRAGQKPLAAGPGVRAEGTVYEIGSFVVDAKAPRPPLDSDGPRTLDLHGYRMTFHDEFDGPLDVSADGPGTKWTAHTPYHGDFGDARFANPGADSPFVVKDGILAITARKMDGKWRSGLLCSVDPKGAGFAQQYGYFEMRAKFPRGPGTWPAFWLNGLKNLTDKGAMSFEVDIVEQYGHRPGGYHGGMIWWRPDHTHDGVGDQFFVADTMAGFHNYGFLWDEKTMRWFFDGVEVWRQPTPPEAKTPLYVLVNLALGGGWPIDRTPNPSVMLVDYVRVFAKKQGDVRR